MLKNTCIYGIKRFLCIQDSHSFSSKLQQSCVLLTQDKNASIEKTELIFLLKPDVIASCTEEQL